MTPSTDLNIPLFERAKALIPGGVNSPVRAFKAVGGTPRFVKRAQGAYFWDANDQRFIDYIGSWGPMILGHGHPAVLEAVQKAAVEGVSFGATTEREVELAEEILRLVPSMEMIRLVSSGTEAGMSAIRLARGATRRNKIIKFNGCYHGTVDDTFVVLENGRTVNAPGLLGQVNDLSQTAVACEFNDLAGVEAALARAGARLGSVPEQAAAVITAAARAESVNPRDIAVRARGSADTVAELIAELQQRYPGDDDRVAEGVYKFLEVFRAKGWIRRQA